MTNHSDSTNSIDGLAENVRSYASGKTIGIGTGPLLDGLALDLVVGVDDLGDDIGRFSTTVVTGEAWRRLGPAGANVLAAAHEDGGTILIITGEPDLPVADVMPTGWSPIEMISTSGWRLVRIGPTPQGGSLIGDMERSLVEARNSSRRQTGETVDRENMIADLERDLRGARHDLEMAAGALEGARRSADDDRTQLEGQIGRMVSQAETLGSRVDALRADLSIQKARTASSLADLELMRSDLERRIKRSEKVELERDVLRWRLNALQNRRWWRLGPAVKASVTRPWRVGSNLRMFRQAMKPAPSLPRPTMSSRRPKPVSPAAATAPRVTGGAEAPDRARFSPTAVLTPTVVQVMSTPVSFAPAPPAPSLGSLRMAVILDEMSDASFSPECELIRFTPHNWLETLNENPPHLLMVESAWRGNAGSWEYKVGSYSYPDSVGLPHLKALVEWCRQQSIPTVFWNKEDPVHFGKFKEAASLFDVVFTTDAELLDSYTALPGHSDRVVGALPFAAQPSLHNPTGAMGERDPRPVFAGTFYSNRHEDRQVQMEMLLDAALPFGLVIYDRMGGKVSDSFGYPERFQGNILGSLPYAEMVDVYRRHKVFLNTNSVTSSPTMFSRRVFELLACGTPVVSTPSRGVSQMFGDTVRVITSAEEAEGALRDLLTDETTWRDVARRGILEIASEHLYKDRIQTVLEAARVSFQPEPCTVGVILGESQHDSIEAFVQAGSRSGVVGTFMIEGDGAADLAKRYERSPVSVVPLAETSTVTWLAHVDEPDDLKTVSELVTIGRLVSTDVVGVVGHPEQEHTYVTSFHGGPWLFSPALATGAGWSAQDPGQMQQRGARLYGIVPTR